MPALPRLPADPAVPDPAAGGQPADAHAFLPGRDQAQAAQPQAAHDGAVQEGEWVAGAGEGGGGDAPSAARAECLPRAESNASTIAHVSMAAYAFAE